MSPKHEKASHTVSSATAEAKFGHGHQDLDEDFAALQSVLGIADFAQRLRPLKNSLASLKTRFSR